MKTELWNVRYRHLLSKKTEEWSINNVIKAVKDLKSNKTRDPFGIYNETFKDCAEEGDLMRALEKLVNGIKTWQYLPKHMSYGNITSIYKNKGSRRNLENDRGIFILNISKKS